MSRYNAVRSRVPSGTRGKNDDGKRIAYVAFRDNGPDVPPGGAIWTVRANGHHPQQVSDPRFFSFRPNWTTTEGD